MLDELEQWRPWERQAEPAARDNVAQAKQEAEEYTKQTGREVRVQGHAWERSDGTGSRSFTWRAQGTSVSDCGEIAAGGRGRTNSRY